MPLIKTYIPGIFIKVALLVFSSLLLCGLHPYCQQQLLNLNSDYKKAKTTQQKSSALFALAKYYLNKNTDSCIFFSQLSASIADKENDKKALARAMIIEGKAEVKNGKSTEGIQRYYKALKICEQQNYYSLSAKIYNNLGIMYAQGKDFKMSLNCYKKALQQPQEKDDIDNTPISQVYVNIAETFSREKLYDSAKIYNEKALVMLRNLKDSLGTAIVLYNMGDGYITRGKFKEALAYIDTSRNISEKIKDNEGVVFCNNNLGTIYYKLGDYKSSIKFASKALIGSEKVALYQKAAASKTLYLNFKKLKNYEKALFYRNLEVETNDSLSNTEKDKQITAIRSNYEVEKKQHEIDLLLIENENSRLVQKAITSVTILISILFISVSWGYLKIRRFKRAMQLQNAEIVEKNYTLADLNETKNKLFSIVSHDLKGPFSLFRNIVELIKTNKITQNESHEFLMKLGDSFTRTFTLLDNLLYWANTQVDGIRVNKTVFNIWEVINQNIQLIEARADEKQVGIITNETQQPVNVNADRLMIDIAIRNLLENAVKFSVQSGEVSITVEMQQGIAKVSVKDNGKGISYADQNKVFDKSLFYSTQGTEGEKGNGLGLNITKDMIEKNGGKINFESIPDKETCFYFTIDAVDGVN